jgi:hypothetical protein
MIRPPDPAVRGTTLAYMQVGSAEAVRRVLDLAYRDCETALDLTYGTGAFWKGPRPPGLTLETNSPDPAAPTDHHLDFRRTYMEYESFDLVIYDPPHLADGGANGVLAARYGTVNGVHALKRLVQDGLMEAWRLARLGLLVKVTDHYHGGELVPLSHWVRAPLHRPYLVLHTYRPHALLDGRWRVQRAPRSNGATYLAFCKDGWRHKDFERLYERQQARLSAA